MSPSVLCVVILNVLCVVYYCVLCFVLFCVVCCDSQCSPQAGQQQEVCKCVVEEEVGPQLAQSNPFQGGRATVKILAQLVQIHMLVQIHNWCKYTTGAPRIHTCNEQRARTQCLFEVKRFSAVGAEFTILL